MGAEGLKTMERELSETLFELIGGLYESDSHIPISVDSIEIAAPVSVRLRWSEDGVSLLASPPVTSYRTGIEQVVQPLKVTAVAARTETALRVTDDSPSEDVDHGRTR